MMLCVFADDEHKDVKRKEKQGGHKHKESMKSVKA